MAVLFWTILGVVLHLQAARSEMLEVAVKEPQGPIVVGSDVTLECLTSDLDASFCKFQMYQRWLRTWMTIDIAHSLRCWLYNINVTRTNSELLMQVKSIYKWHAGPYRCICNSTDGEIESQAITVPLQYLNDICIQEQQSRFPYLMRRMRVIRVMKGKDLDLKCTASSSQTPSFQWHKQGSDWIYPNSSLRIKEISPEDGGTYTCKATHPLVPTLTLSKSVQIVVMKEPLSSFQLSEVNLILVVALPMGILLLAAIGITACIWRARRHRAKGAPLLDDHVVKTPIWKAGSSTSSIAISDSVPLVM
ncbi:lachesin [Narcine bancroftii]|uniref:lachesin n=1 Tax=Narcine bancroftii TaxID=1343680 RepID=UPI003831E351